MTRKKKDEYTRCPRCKMITMWDHFRCINCGIQENLWEMETVWESIKDND